MSDVEIKGTITIDGVTTEFMFTKDGFSQWGGTTEQLGDRMEFICAIEEGLSMNTDFFGPEEDDEPDPDEDMDRHVRDEEAQVEGDHND